MPVVVTDDGALAAQQAADVVTDPESANVDSVVTEVRNRGRYPVPVTMAEYHRLEGDAAGAEKLFERECLEQVQRWLALGRERLEPHQIPLYVTGGNDDYEFIEPVLTEDPYAINANGQVVVVGPGLEMISTWPWQYHAMELPAGRN